MISGVTNGIDKDRIKGAATGVALAAALLAAHPALTAAPARAQAAPARVSYVPDGDRQMIFVNNPERLEVGYTDAVPGSVSFGQVFNDLADPELGNKLISQITVQPGRYRDLFEHVWNAANVAQPAAAQEPIHYGVFVYNPNRESITVRVLGRGFVVGPDGGKPIADALNENAANPGGTVHTIEPGHLLWVMRTDLDYENRPILPRQFFSGMIDFDVEGGPAVVANLAYQDLASLTRNASDDAAAAGAGDSEGSGNGKGKGKKGNVKAIINAKHLNPGLADMGYIWRRYSATAAAESRVYKGLMVYPDQTVGGSGVATTLNFTVSDATNGDLRVTYPKYVNANPGGLNNFIPSPTVNVNNPFWFTHNVPIRDTATISVVGNDMFDIVTPNYGRLFALFQTNAPNTIFGQANFGNWGVLYRETIIVNNTGTRERTLELKLNHNGTVNNNSPIAYQRADGTWTSTILKNTPFTYRTFTIPPGQSTRVEGNFALGCPGLGTLRHTLTLR